MPEMMIKFDDLRRYCENHHCGSVPLEYIKQMRTVEAEPVRLCKWLPTKLKGYYECSACRFEHTTNPKQHFCSFCGARMDSGPLDNLHEVTQDDR